MKLFISVELYFVECMAPNRFLCDRSQGKSLQWNLYLGMQMTRCHLFV